MIRVGRQRLSHAQTWALAHAGRRLELADPSPTARYVFGHPATIRKLVEYGLVTTDTWHRAGELAADADEHARAAFHEIVRRFPSYAPGYTSNQPTESEAP